MSDIIDILVTAIAITMTIGTLCLLLGVFYIGGLLWAITFILMFIVSAIAQSQLSSPNFPEPSHEYEETDYISVSTHKECRACSGTGRCQQCRGTGKTGWSGTRTMSERRCPICLGSGSCAVCRGTASRGHF